MQTLRFLAGVLLLAVLISGCEKAQPYTDKVKKALERESEPKQVVGMHDEEATAAAEAAAVPPPPEPEKIEPVINKDAKIAILGYHRFTDTRKPTDMIIDIDDFRAQMQAIKDSELPVISMKQFLDWKQGKAPIPSESVLITIDDGWKSTHSLAMPVMREFGFPFTAYLYKDYINIGGASMTHDEVKELIEAGGTICSHSITHDFMNRQRGRSDEKYTEWLTAEFTESHDYLVEQYGEEAVLKTFAYPYGAYNSRVVEVAKECGYEAAFTVSPGKANWDSVDLEVSRYIIHGNNAQTFDAAIRFGGRSSATASGRKLLSEQRDKKTGEVKGPLVSVYPPANSTVRNRLPRIEASLNSLEGIQEDSVSMRVTGLGKVAHRYSAAEKKVVYQIPQRIRLDSIGVQLSFRHSGNGDMEVIGWNFNIDKQAEYLDATATILRDADEPVDPERDLINPEDKKKAEEKESEAAEGDAVEVAEKDSSSDESLLDPTASSN